MEKTNQLLENKCLTCRFRQGCPDVRDGTIECSRYEFLVGFVSRVVRTAMYNFWNFEA